MQARVFGLAALGFLILAVPGCKSGPQVQDDKTADLRDGMPVWVTKPCAGQPVDAICAAGTSDFASADVEAAKTDAETAAKNKIAEQLEADVGRLTERLSEAVKDLSNGKTLGARTVKDINKNFKEQTLRGLRYEEYFYYPNSMEPKKIWVHAVLTVDSNKMSQDIADAMLASAATERLEMKHADAMNRFDAVRKQYLDEKRAKAEQVPGQEAKPANAAAQ